MDEQEIPLAEYSEKVRKKISKYFSVYERKEEELLAFYIEIPSDERLLEYRFRALTNELKEMHLTPVLRREGVEYVLFIIEKPVLKPKSPLVNLGLFCVTLITTMLSGSLLFSENMSFAEITNTTNLLNGLLFFSFPLLAILGIHEWGHYYVAQKHGIAASLPFFIPATTSPSEQ